MQTFTTALGELTIPTVTPEQERAAADFEASQREERRKQRLVDSGMPLRFRDVPPDGLPPEVASYAANLGEYTTRGLLIHGPFGSGKTRAACHVLSAAASRWPVRFVTAPELVAEAMQFERADMSPYRNSRFLCIDDLGKERPTEFAMEQVYGIIDYRWREGKPTVITTNHDARGLRAHFAKVADKETAGAIMSRILGMCTAVRMDGRDRRLP